MKWLGVQYHWLNGGMWNCVKLMELELVLRPNVDVSAFVFRAVAVPRSREYCEIISQQWEEIELAKSYL